MSKTKTASTPAKSEAKLSGLVLCVEAEERQPIIAHSGWSPMKGMERLWLHSYGPLLAATHVIVLQNHQAIDGKFGSNQILGLTWELGVVH